MASALGVDEVEGLKHLSEVVAADSFSEGLQGHIVEEFTTGNELKNDVRDLLLGSIFLDLFGDFFKVDELHNVGVIEALVYLNFTLEQNEGFVVDGGVGKVENLESNLLAVGVLSKFNLSGDSGTKSLQKSVLVNSGWHFGIKRYLLL